MSASAIFVCDSCGRDDFVRIEQFSAMLGALIPNGWSITSRQNRPPRVLCPGCDTQFGDKP